MKPDTGMLTLFKIVVISHIIYSFVVNEANGHVKPSSSLRFAKYALDRGGWLALILGHCRCVG